MPQTARDDFPCSYRMDCVFDKQSFRLGRSLAGETKNVPTLVANILELIKNEPFADRVFLQAVWENFSGSFYKRIMVDGLTMMWRVAEEGVAQELKDFLVIKVGLFTTVNTSRHFPVPIKR